MTAEKEKDPVLFVRLEKELLAELDAVTLEEAGRNTARPNRAATVRMLLKEALRVRREVRPPSG